VNKSINKIRQNQTFSSRFGLVLSGGDGDMVVATVFPVGSIATVNFLTTFF